MPTNVTPEYKEAKAAFQRAKDPAERLSCLKEMLRTVPKHKGTDHLQADIRSRIKALSEELVTAKKKGGRAGPALTVRPEGAAQVALIGPPNSGKSSLHARLTGSHAEVAPYPRTTRFPMPGMLPFEDIRFQLADLPPISSSFMEPWFPNALQTADAALLVVDLTSPDCVEDVAAIHERLNEKGISLVPEWPYRLDGGATAALPGAVGDAAKKRAGSDEEDAEALEDPFRVHLPVLLVATKSDLGWDPGEVKVLKELAGLNCSDMTVSVETGEGLDGIASLLFRGLGVVRVYTKIPGRPPEFNAPFTLFRGDTVFDVARLVHKELANSFKFAKVWGSGKFDGQQVGRDHLLGDRDILELHT